MNQSTFSEKRDRSTEPLRRLRDHAPELHAEVMAGAKPVYRAAVEAGVSPRRVGR